MRHYLMINIETDSGTARIKLLNNSFVNKWKEHFIFMLSNDTQRIHNMSSFPYLLSNYVEAGILTNRVTALKEVIEELNTFVTFPVSIDDIDKRTARSLDFMQLLNEIHRHCTTAVRVLRTNTHKLHWGDNIKFTIGNHDVDRFAILMHKLNLSVHAVDCCVPTPRKLEHNENRINVFETSFDFTEPEVIDLTEDKKVFFKHSHNYQTPKYMSDSDDYDVWLQYDILGKTYQEAYFDHDDPTEWDVTHPLGHSGGFHINLTDITLQTLIKSDEMQNWFKSYNMDYTPMMNNFPLGNVVEGKNYLQELTPSGKHYVYCE